MINCPESEIVSTERYQKQFYKTSMCKYFLENSCKKGIHCSHAHSPEELQEKPVLSKTRMCKQILRNGNCTDYECTFAHDIDELVAANAFFRTKMCEFFASSSGCKLGDKCRYAHSNAELTPSAPVSKKSIPLVDFNDSPDTGYPMRKRGSGGSKSTMAGGSYASFGSLASFREMAAPSVPLIYVYPYTPAMYPVYPEMAPYED